MQSMPIRLAIRTAALRFRSRDTRPDFVPQAEYPRGATSEIVLNGNTLVIGRAPTAHVRLPGPAVSLVHARLERDGSDWFVIDQGSTNGTRLNGTLLQPYQRRLVRTGDTLEVPGFVLSISVADNERASPPETTHEIARKMVREVLQALGGSLDSAPSLVVAAGPKAGTRLVLSEIGQMYIVGRSLGCHLQLDDRDVSREHAGITRDFMGVTIEDLGSKNGILVRGRRITAPCQLSDGDELLLGSTPLRFNDPAEAYLRELEGGEDAKAWHEAAISEGKPLMPQATPSVPTAKPEAPSGASEPVSKQGAPSLSDAPPLKEASSPKEALSLEQAPSSEQAPSLSDAPPLSHAPPPGAGEDARSGTPEGSSPDPGAAEPVGSPGPTPTGVGTIVLVIVAALVAAGAAAALFFLMRS